MSWPRSHRSEVVGLGLSPSWSNATDVALSLLSRLESHVPIGAQWVPVCAMVCALLRAMEDPLSKGVTGKRCFCPTPCLRQPPEADVLKLQIQDHRQGL